MNTTTNYTDMSLEELVSLHSYHMDMAIAAFEEIMKYAERPEMEDRFAAAKEMNRKMKWNPQ